MKATVDYHLSSSGQKAALAAGLSATASQKAEIEVSNGDLQLFEISSNGSLSADATKSAIRDWSGSSWQAHAFDVPPSPADLVDFLRQRVVERERVVAAEAQVKEQKRIEEEQKRAQRELQKQAEIAAMHARIVAANEQGVDDGLNVSSNGVGVADCRLTVGEYPAAAEFAARVKAQAEVDGAKKLRIAAINAAAPHRAARQTTPTADGKWRFTCPSSTLDGDWAKRVVSVDTAQKGGYALEGTWLKANDEFALPAGEIIVVGGKEWEGSKRHGGYVREATIYVITPAGVRHMGKWSKTEPAVAKVTELLALTPAERCRIGIERAIALCEKNLAALYALDRTTYAEEFSAEIEPRIAEWTELKQECERALLGGAGDEKITDVDSAAAAIVAAGFRALAEKHHPDKGGEQNTFILVAEAKKQLVELLKLAAQGVGA